MAQTKGGVTSPLTVLGIDPSLTSLGLAAIRSDGLRAETRAVQVPGTGIPRLLALRDAVLEWVRAYAPAVVAMEGYSMAPRAGRLADLGELGGVLKVALWEMGYRTDQGRLLVVPPALVKKYATGQGNADKGAVRVAVYKRWGFEARTDDETDAYVLARIALAWAAMDTDLTAFQRDVLARLGAADSRRARADRMRAAGE